MGERETRTAHARAGVRARSVSLISFTARARRLLPVVRGLFGLGDTRVRNLGLIQRYRSFLIPLTLVKKTVLV